MQQIGSEIAAQSKVKGHFCPHHLCPVAFLFCMSVCISSARNGSVGFIAAEVDSCIGRSVGRAMQSSLLLIAGQLRLLNCEWPGSARHSG